jgi:phosphatidylserine/phosphatidylglycerophosphate/cardiolipin synthase-like enzyme
LPKALAQKSATYVWARERRPSRTEGGEDQLGVLHAKCALADDSLLLVSSANLTPDALKLNIEMGILVRHGAPPMEARRLFDALVERGDIRPVAG